MSIFSINFKKLHLNKQSNGFITICINLSNSFINLDEKQISNPNPIPILKGQLLSQQIIEIKLIEGSQQAIFQKNLLNTINSYNNIIQFTVKFIPSNKKYQKIIISNQICYQKDTVYKQSIFEQSLQQFYGIGSLVNIIFTIRKDNIPTKQSNKKQVKTFFNKEFCVQNKKKSNSILSQNSQTLRNNSNEKNINQFQNNLNIAKKLYLVKSQKSLKLLPSKKSNIKQYVNLSNNPKQNKQQSITQNYEKNLKIIHQTDDSLINIGNLQKTRHQVESKQKLNTTFNHEIRNLQSENRLLHSKIRDFSFQINKKDNQNNHLKDRLNCLQKNYSTKQIVLRSQIDAKMNKIKSLSEDIFHKQIQIQELKNTLNRNQKLFQQKNFQLQSQLIQKNELLQKKQIQQLKRIRQIKQNKQMSQDWVTLQKYNKKHTQLVEMSQKYEDSQDMISRLNEDLSLSKFAIKNLTQKLKQLQCFELIHKQNEIEHLNQLIDENSKQIDYLNNVNYELRQQMLLNSKIIHQNTNKIQHMNIKIVQKDIIIQNQELQLSKIRNSLQTVNNKLRLLQSKFRKDSNMNQVKRQMQRSIQEISQKNKQLQRQQSHKDKVLRQKQIKLRQLQLRIKQSTKFDKQIITQISSQQQQLRNELISKQKMIIVLGKQLQKCRKQKQKQQEHKQKQRQLLAALQLKYTHSIQNSNKNNHKYNQLSYQNLQNQFKQSHQLLRKKQIQIEQFKRKYKKYKELVNQYQTIQSNLKNQIQILKIQQNKFLTKITQLKKYTAHIINQIDQKNINKLKQIKNTKQIVSLLYELRKKMDFDISFNHHILKSPSKNQSKKQQNMKNSYKSSDLLKQSKQNQTSGQKNSTKLTLPQELKQKINGKIRDKTQIQIAKQRINKSKSVKGLFHQESSSTTNDTNVQNKQPSLLKVPQIK